MRGFSMPPAANRKWRALTSILRGPKFRREERETRERAQELLDCVGLGRSSEHLARHKDDAGSVTELDPVTVTVGGAPRPEEIVVICALSDGGRPRPRVAKSGIVPPPQPRSR